MLEYYKRAITSIRPLNLKMGLDRKRYKLFFSWDAVWDVKLPQLFVSIFETIESDGAAPPKTEYAGLTEFGCIWMMQSSRLSCKRTPQTTGPMLLMLRWKLPHWQSDTASRDGSTSVEMDLARWLHCNQWLRVNHASQTWQLFSETIIFSAKN